jgi:hypothetical protein
VPRSIHTNSQYVLPNFTPAFNLVSNTGGAHAQIFKVDPSTRANVPKYVNHRSSSCFAADGRCKICIILVINAKIARGCYLLLRIIVSRTLLLALTPILWTVALLSHALLLPSATLIISRATRSANLVSLRLSALLNIHCIAVLLLCFTPSGTGIGSDAPPPMTPFCCRILIKGATESIAAAKYCMGDKGRKVAGGKDPRSGRAGLV